jgi:hypothetical protein
VGNYFVHPLISDPDVTRLQFLVTEGRLQSGFPFLAAVVGLQGTCLAAHKLASALTRLVLPAASWGSPLALDTALAACAETLKDLPGRSALAMAICCAVPGAAGPSGGIVGSPHIPPQPAHGEAEPLGYGLVTVANPGGPGLVAYCDTLRAKQLLHDLPTGQGGQTLLSTIITRAQGIPFAMAVTDATAVTGGPGGIAVRSGQQVHYFLISASE